MKLSWQKKRPLCVNYEKVLFASFAV